MGRVSNYELARRQAMQLYLSFDEAEIAERLGLQRDDKGILVSFLGRPYRAERQGGVLRRLWDGAEGGFGETLTVYDYLCESKRGCHPAGEYVTVGSLQAVVTSTIGGGMNAAAVKWFASDMERARRRCLAMGGRETGQGDLGFAFPVFAGGLDLRLSFWAADEDFPASLRLYWDKNVLDYIRFETTYYAGGFLLEELMDNK